MNTFQLTRAMLMLSVLSSTLAGRAASGPHIPEPATMFYGQVIERHPQRDFLIAAGELVWTIHSPQLGKEYQLKTQLQPLANGRYSYSLKIPHHVLAFDLSVAPKALPLTGGPLAMQHGSILLNGEPLRVIPPAVDGFSAEQANRARAYRIDLQLATNRPDSDGDGFPDWWEDLHGYDKWDSSDGLGLAQTGESVPGQMFNFAQWRAAHFSGDESDLDLFARADHDGDGIVNLLEYAFHLDPKSSNEAPEARRNLPATRVEDGRGVLTFRGNAAATDLIYVIEVSEDLIQWSPAGDRIEPVEPSDAQSGPGWVSVRLVEDTGQTPHCWMRVVVQRIP
jgi:hypothetical protein